MNMTMECQVGENQDEYIDALKERRVLWKCGTRWKWVKLKIKMTEDSYLYLGEFENTTYFYFVLLGSERRLYEKNFMNQEAGKILLGNEVWLELISKCNQAGLFVIMWISDAPGCNPTKTSTSNF